MVPKSAKQTWVVAPGMTRDEYCFAAECLGVLLGLESHQQLAADIEHRALDHRRLREHQRDRLLLREPFLVLVRKLAERGAGAVEQRLPSARARPALERAAVDAGALVVVEAVATPRSSSQARAFFMVSQFLMP
jgi:hypothetical protein